MQDDPEGPGFGTRLVQMGRPRSAAQTFVNPPLERGSSVLFPSVAARDATRARPFDQVLTYGLKGGPTHFHLEDAVAEIEGGSRSQIVSTGLAAVTAALMAYLRGGQHCLVPDSVYGPTRTFLDGMGAGFGIATTYYPPTIDEGGLRAMMRANTALVYAESPGSHTMEVQDVAMLARVAHGAGARLVLDNTWGLSFFRPFDHGVDCSIQAGTKYLGGHSDLLLGALTTSDDANWQRVRSTATTLGHYASPDDCWLALRSLRTLRVRMQEQMRSGLEVAGWLRGRPEVIEVLHPALPGARGHDLWKRDFSGAASLFSVVLAPRFDHDDLVAMIDALRLFGIGASWGGFESLVLPTAALITRTVEAGKFPGQIMRLHVGLEDTRDLIADLEAGFEVLARHAAGRAGRPHPTPPDWTGQ
ncbi:MAG: cystathionine beta-lyase [Rhodobacteraceae bacterium]|nr:cystathionine beta-lyase [Paracoccaceae bacterium]